MPRHKVAHLNQQGVDLIIIPLDDSFGHKSTTVQQEAIAELQMRANTANLRGTVVPYGIRVVAAWRSSLPVSGTLTSPVSIFCSWRGI